jgi:hypothetical protein
MYETNSIGTSNNARKKVVFAGKNRENRSHTKLFD